MVFYHQIFNRVFRKTREELKDSHPQGASVRKKVVSKNKKEHKLKIKTKPGEK